MPNLTTIAFDGDDTLWHNETVFSMTEERITALLADHIDPAELSKHLLATETANLHRYGYGAKSFILSMIETAIEVTDGRVSTKHLNDILDFGKEMLDHPVELLDGVEECIATLAADDRYRLLVITKGDLFHQESKVARSGLAELFWKVEIVVEKDIATYRRIMTAHAIDPAEFAMVGNSLRSDIIPVLQLGATAIHVPYPLVWAHEHVDPATVAELRWHEIGSLGAIPALLDELR